MQQKFKIVRDSETANMRPQPLGQKDYSQRRQASQARSYLEDPKSKVDLGETGETRLGQSFPRPRRICKPTKNTGVASGRSRQANQVRLTNPRVKLGRATTSAQVGQI